MMAPINTCLRKTFIVIDVIIGILGIIWLVLSLIIHGILHASGQDNLSETILVYVIGVVIVVTCAVGLYGILKKKQWALIVFSVGMIAISLPSLVEAVSTTVKLNMTEENAKVALKLEGSLDGQTLATQSRFTDLQERFQCCGFLNGVHDWGNVIPPSCRCPDTLENSAHCISLNVTWRKTSTTEEIQVYEQPCFPYLFNEVRKEWKIEAAVNLTYILCMVVGAVLSIIILCQMRKKTFTPPVTFTTHASDSKFAELE
ncbi:tetraspanin-8-like [Sardina pilchardus]|uniref:tetraspanin-8-like n=1 Tax=Sardina pilchardus TaxID=27697 RepID=UPI002E124647